MFDVEISIRIVLEIVPVIEARVVIPFWSLEWGWGRNGMFS